MYTENKMAAITLWPMRSHNMAFPSADLKNGLGQLFINKQLTFKNQFLVLNRNPVSVENGGSAERWLGVVGHWLDWLSSSYWYIQASGAKMSEGRVAVGLHGDGGPGSGGGSVVAEPGESAGVLLLLSG